MLENICAVFIIIALNVYAVSGGADYGGGVWDLFAGGPRAARQRDVIAEAIGPIWEANHVWLVFVIVVLFTAFPPAFALIGTTLHIPVTLLLIGIVLRGSSFVFRAYGGQADTERRQWSVVFAVSSLITPVWLGVIVGAISSGRATASAARGWDILFRPWLHAFSFAVGFFALALFAFIAAVYLTLESADPELQEDFRARALIAATFVGVMALIVFVLANDGAPAIRRALAASWWTWPLQASTALAALGAIYGLWARRFHLARLCAVGQVSLILWGWAFAQYPHLVVPSATIANSAAPQETLALLLAASAGGAVLLVPAFFYLLRVFKGEQ